MAQELGEVLQRLITRLGQAVTEYTGPNPRRTFLEIGEIDSVVSALACVDELLKSVGVLYRTQL